MATQLKMTKAVKAKVEKALRAETPIAQISKSVGVSVPTIYHHFPGGVRGMRKQVEKEAKRAKRRAA